MKKIYIFMALCLMSVMSVRAMEVTVYDGKVKNAWAPFALSYGNGWTESQYVIPESELGDLFDKTITGVKYYCDWTSAFTSSMSVNFFMWEEPNSVTSLNGFRSAKAGFVGYEGQVSFVMNNGVCEATITFNQPLVYVGGSLVFYNWSNPGGKNNVSFYGKTVQGACWAGNNEEMGGVMANVGQRNFAPKTTFICEDEPVDEREALTYFRLSGFDNSGIKAGITWTESLCKSIANAIQPDGNAPWHINADWAYLMVYNENTNVLDKVEFGTQLKGGKYYYRVEIAINDGLTDTYRIPGWDQEDIIVVVDGESWDVTVRNTTYGSFEIESPEFQVLGQGIEDVQSDKVQSTKVIREGQLLIERGGKTYNAQGMEVK